MRATLIIGVVLVAEIGLGAQDSLSAAKDLYASAAYEDALSTLVRIDGGSTTADIARQVDEYRAFCLYALGRTQEADSIAEAIIRKAPLARLGADASPRLEMMFTDVRKRLLPSLIRDRFRMARSALDRKSVSEAEPLLTEAQLLIVEADKLGVKVDGLGDLSVLVDGFLQLIRSAPEPRASQPAAAAHPIVTPPAPDARPVATSPAPDSRPVVPSPAPVGDSRVYAVGDEGVSPPAALDQRMPSMTNEMRLVTQALRTTGVLDIVIDETGRVVDATIRKSLSSSFDALIVRSARHWKYRPATKNGVPVRYVKTLVLVP
jgi:hypothetical protein